MPKLELPEPPPPHQGRLAGPDDDWWNNACIDPSGVSWTTYASGYLAGARVLVQRVADTKMFQDVLVYPIVFLYRQYLELILKYLAMTSSQLLGDTVSISKSNGHSLLVQWRLVKPRIKALERSMQQETITAAELAEVEDLLEQFESVDRKSSAFRYPVDTDGEPSLPLDLTHLNVRRFRDAMNRLSHLLDKLVNTTEYHHEFFGPVAGP